MGVSVGRFVIELYKVMKKDADITLYGDVDIVGSLRVWV